MNSNSSEELLAWIARTVGRKRIAKWPDIAQYTAREIGVKSSKNLTLRGAANVIIIGGQPHRCVIACGSPDDFEKVKITQDANQILINSQDRSQEDTHGTVQIITGHVGMVAGRDLTINGKIMTSPVNSTMALPIICLALPEIPNVTSSGSGDVLLLNAEQERIELAINGSGNMSAEGRVSVMSAIIQGSGSIHASKLKAKSANLFVMGSGDIAAHAHSDVLAKVMGSGDVKIHGQPESVEQTVLGSGRIKIRK